MVYVDGKQFSQDLTYGPSRVLRRPRRGAPGSVESRFLAQAAWVVVLCPASRSWQGFGLV